MMKKFYSLLSVLCIVFYAYGVSGWTSTGSSVSEQVKFGLVSSNRNTSIVCINITGYTMKEVQTPTGIKYVPVIEGATPIYEKGAPDLLKSTVSLIIPDKGVVSAEVISSEYTDYHDIEIAPSKGIIYISQDADNIPYIFGEQYQKNEYFPSDLVKLRDPHIMRDVRGIAADLFPLRYNPVSKTLRVYSEIIVEITTDDELTGMNEKDAGNHPEDVNVFNSLYKDHYINYNELFGSRDLSGLPNGRMLIISYGDFMDEMQPYVDWKLTKGIETEIVDVSTIGDADAIKTYVSNYYNSNSDFAYLLLVGDYDQVSSVTTSSISGYPSYMDPGPYASDNKYTMIQGSDNYPEIICGRISAESEQEVTTQVNKFIIYEKEPQTQTNYYNKGAGFSVQKAPDNYTDIYPKMQAVKSTLINEGGYVEFTELYENGYGDMEPTASNISSMFNEGRSYLGWICHGEWDELISFSFSTSNAGNLSNTGMWPYIWNCSCMTGKFHKNAAPCFSESLLRAESGGEPAGALSVAMSNIMMMEGASEEFPNEAAIRLTDDSFTDKTYGGITFDTYIDVALGTYNQPNEFVYMIIFGDPSILLRTQMPQQLTVTHSPMFQPGITQIDVTCDVEGAYIAVTDKNTHEILGTGYISGGGASITLSTPLADEVTICGTAFNYIPYIGNAGIGSLDDPYYSIVYVDITDDDDASGTLDPGESANINVTAKNLGADASADATITATCSDITITNGSQNLGILSSGAETPVAFAVEIPGTMIEGTEITVTFSLSDGTYNATIDKTFIVGEIPVIVMDNSQLTTCAGEFYDPGGTGEYGNNLDYTMTIYPTGTDKKLEVTFTSFDIEDESNCNYDYLEIYDGTSTSATLIGKYCGTDSPGTVTATNPDGALSFHFYSDVYVTAPGWTADITCNMVVDIEETETTDFSIYPNPSSGEFFIETAYPVNEVADIVVYDMYGKMIMHIQEPETDDNVLSLDLSNMATGLYYINVITKVHVQESFTGKVLLVK